MAIGSNQEVGTFTDLQNDVNYAIANNKTLEFNKSYVYNNVTDFKIHSGIRINHSLVINGNNFTIDAKGKTSIFNIVDCDNVILNDINFINGNSANPKTGGAIYSTALQLTVNNCVFSYNEARSAGAIDAIGNLNVNYCKFYNNTARNGASGAIHGGKENTIRISYSLFEGNKAIIYGGAICANKAYLYIDHSTFIANSVENKGGAICIANGGTISNSIFLDNYAGDGGAAINGATNTVIIVSNCYIKDNVALNNGAGIRVGINNTLYVLDTDFIGNEAYQGAAIYACEDASVTASGNLFDKNNATDGSIIYNSAYMFITNSKVNSFDGFIDNEGILLSDVTISVLNNSIIYSSTGEIIKLYATVTTDNLPVVDGNFSFIINGTFIEAINEGNYFVADYEFTGGDVIVSAKYDNVFNPTILNGFITSKIKTVIDASDLVIVAYDTKNLIVTLKDVDGNVIADKEITISFDGKDYVKTTDDNGVVRLPITSKYVNVYPVIITFDGDDVYLSSFEEVDVIIKPAYVAVNDIIKASVNVKKYVAKNKRIPATVQVGSVKCTYAQYSYLASAAIKNINAKKKLSTKVEVINVVANNKKTTVKVKATKKQYLKIVNSLYTKAVSGKLPSYITVSGKKVGFNDYTLGLANILSFYNSNKRLPNYLIFTSKY